jgi:hypothetical protein
MIIRSNTLSQHPRPDLSFQIRSLLAVFSAGVLSLATPIFVRFSHVHSFIMGRAGRVLEATLAVLSFQTLAHAVPSRHSRRIEPAAAPISEGAFTYMGWFVVLRVGMTCWFQTDQQIASQSR